MIAAALVIALLNFRGVQLSARTGTILGTFEVVVFVALAVWLIVKAGSGNTVFKFVAPLSYPSSDTGLVIGIWFLIGAAVLLYLYARHPSRLPEMKRVFADEPLATAGKS
jgi:amino acid transporter